MDRLSQLSRLGLFDRSVPRYTSYPTAPQFGRAVGPRRARSWLQAVPAGARVSLYIHVPFCRRLCWFCACRTQGTGNLDVVRRYLDTLLAELAMVAAALPKGVALSRLHWGGGTPTLLSPDMIKTLAGAVDEVLPPAPGREFSVEIDPNEADEARLDALVRAGMTRASVGVQDFDGRVQAAIGRDQSFERTRDVAEALRAVGVDSLNADILYGLPHQTRPGIADCVQRLLSLGPDRVALYGYAHVPWMARRQTLIPADALPGPEERLHLFETARRLLLWDGYEEIGIDHFARPEDGLAKAAAEGRLRRNFQGYTDDAADILIGLGASAISRFPQGYAQNAAGTGDYTGAIRSGGLATARGHVFAGEDRMRARMIEALMCDFRIDAAEMTRRFGVSPAKLQALFAEAVTRFGEVLELSEAGLRIRRDGRPLTRIIARSFDAYGAPEARHSTAV